MSRGTSKRVVIEVDPGLKHQLYVALAEENLTLKEWFVRAASKFLAERRQPSLLNLHDTVPKLRKKP